MILNSLWTFIKNVALLNCLDQLQSLTCGDQTQLCDITGTWVFDHTRVCSVLKKRLICCVERIFNGMRLADLSIQWVLFLLIFSTYTCTFTVHDKMIISDSQPKNQTNSLYEVVFGVSRRWSAARRRSKYLWVRWRLRYTYWRVEFLSACGVGFHMLIVL